MSELRKDPIVGRWIIISTERIKRNFDWISKPQFERVAGFCPFCEGNEDKTPPEILAYRSTNSKANEPGWKIRVVPNKFPALQIEGNLDRQNEGIFDKMNGIGAHEVIIESPEHSLRFVDFSLEHIRDILWVFRERILELKKDSRFKYVLIFKNEGFAAGASLEHSHSQLIATPIVPEIVMEELEGFRRYYNLKKQCIFCELIQHELKFKTRIVTQSQSFVTFEPFAPRFAFETWIFPLYHWPRYEDMEYNYFYELASILRETLQRINNSIDNPPYNFILHSCPKIESIDIDFHWHIEIIPKLTNVAGFEWGSGININPVPPEDAAELLRANY